MERNNDVTRKETLIVQAVLENQVVRLDERINRIDSRFDLIQEELNGKHGIKERLVVIQHQNMSLLCVGRWIAGIFATLLIGLFFWFITEQWQTRDFVKQLMQQQQKSAIQK